MKTVLAQTSGLAAIASTFWAMYSAPAAGQEFRMLRLGRRGDKPGHLGQAVMPGVVLEGAAPFTIPRWYSGEERRAVRYCRNQASALLSKLSSCWYTFQLIPARCSRSG